MSVPEIIRPNIRRAILDLLNDTGGQLNDDVIARLLASLGHRVARRDIREELAWLKEKELVKTEEVGPFLVGEITPDGIDCSDGNLRIEGVLRHRTGR
ncbi:hypothetical protein QQS45_00180 [Alteriqipengyuania flavescens]|uniref:VpaChn25_0724 family phage protein n=1 Tax=Alteriqipengyuania flavescens TaxID=3053610 RepID=UPI0025B3B83B|nr:hypothetical protein [Alteriqipengyuania flavescens]WJY18707.1 hypothetical protein QQW98_00180 [Alteriqipengyuania flavescens]WJY24647.1 hypothetical protein QQS45_00180 [Alteriqipengyuania flavescens]